MWLLLGCYNTQERLEKMKKVPSPYCVICPDDGSPAEIETQVHFLLSCRGLAETREDFLRQLVDLSPIVVNYMDVSDSFLLFSPLSTGPSLTNGSRGAEIQLGSRGGNLQVAEEVLLFHA